MDTPGLTYSFLFSSVETLKVDKIKDEGFNHCFGKNSLMHTHKYTVGPNKSMSFYNLQLYQPTTGTHSANNEMSVYPNVLIYQKHPVFDPSEL